ncbi:hypothetical protein R3W88_024296 [Solanum pinnatisectum]|uniref:Gag-pol polyprotein n=1 Tax=Solanum pinnatisectum TaxID=50273 RepID=A0AAV9M0R3_9SOLN|nr:hypothetical protein R3W88_024296 [Solanum pinnatisectum]
MQDTQYSTIPAQYAVYGAQPYAYPPNYSQWQAPTHQNVRPSSQNFQTPYNSRPRQRLEGGFNPTIRCAYHSDATRHSTEDCRNLRRNVKKMIQTKRIVVQNDDPPNVTENPLSAHNDVHFIEMICGDKEYDNSQEKKIEIVGAFMKASVQSSG